MIRFTPECLARTDFPRLVRNDPSSARERLEALVADPEALDLYGENLSPKALLVAGLSTTRGGTSSATASSGKGSARPPWT